MLGAKALHTKFAAPYCLVLVAGAGTSGENTISWWRRFIWDAITKLLFFIDVDGYTWNASGVQQPSHAGVIGVLDAGCM